MSIFLNENHNCLTFNNSNITTVTRRTAVRETGVSAQLMALLKPPVHHNSIVFRGSRGALNCPPLCRETVQSGSRYAYIVRNKKVL